MVFIEKTTYLYIFGSDCIMFSCERIMTKSGLKNSLQKTYSYSKLIFVKLPKVLTENKAKATKA